MGFLEVLSGVAAAVAVLGALVAVERARRRRNLRRGLIFELTRLRRAQRLVAEAAIRLDDALTRTTTWAGYDIWPPELEHDLNILSSAEVDTEFARTRLRSYDAERSSDERLRADLEEAADLINRAASWYVAGTLRKYRERQGKATQPSTAGRETTAALYQAVSEADFEEHRRRAVLLLRSCIKRLDHEDGPWPGEVPWPLSHRDASSHLAAVVDPRHPD